MAHRMTWTERLLLDNDTGADMFERYSTKPTQPTKIKFPKNYFGLPIYALAQSPQGLIYQCRKAMEYTEDPEEKDNLEGHTSQCIEADVGHIRCRRCAVKHI